jgi:uncharacterized protein
MQFKRTIESKIVSTLFKGSMIILYGPRQAGKTTLAKNIVSQYGSEGSYYDCELADIREKFVVGRPDLLLPLTEGRKVVVFDEAQTIENIGS